MDDVNPLVNVETQEIVATLKGLARAAYEALEAPPGEFDRQTVLGRVDAFHRWCTPVIILHLIEKYEATS